MKSDLPTKSETILHINEGEVFVTKWAASPAQNEKPPILLFHDSLGSVKMWRQFPELLCKSLDRNVIAYDRLGFGKSSKRLDLPTKEFVREESELYLPQILKHLEVTEFIAFGHSVGGAMALTAASEFEHCLAVISVSAQAFVEDRTIKGIQSAQNEFKDPSVFGKLEKYHEGKAEWVLDAWTKVWLSQEFLSWSLQGILPKVKCPILVIHGDMDEYGSIKFPQMIASLSRGKSSCHILEGIGHVPHRENPELVLKLVQDFLAKMAL